MHTQNLIAVEINCDIVASVNERHNINVCYLSTRSVKNKTLSIADYITTHDYDIMCITESWLGSDIDANCIKEMVPLGYDFHHVPRNNGRTCGGVRIIFKTGLSMTLLSSSSTDTDTSHFEYIDCRTEYQGSTIRFIVVYRPPTSTQNGLKTSGFFGSGHLLLSAWLLIIPTASSSEM